MFELSPVAIAVSISFNVCVVILVAVDISKNKRMKNALRILLGFEVSSPGIFLGVCAGVLISVVLLVLELAYSPRLRL